MGLKSYVARRLGLLFLVLLGASVVTFAVTKLVPGDPILVILGERATQEQIDIMRQKWHLDKPVYEQYLIFLWGILHGDLGTSIRSQRPVLRDLVDYFPATFELSTAALLISVAIGIPLGVISATHRNKPIDHMSRVLSLIGVATPVFWLGLLMLTVFYYNLGWGAGPGRISTNMVPPTTITGLYILDSILTGNAETLVDSLRHIIMPAFALGLLNLAVISRMTRSTMLEALTQDYVRTAKAKGLSKNAVYYKHALRNALIPTATTIGLTYGYLLSGAVVTETVFVWPGIGMYAARSALSLDLPAIVGVTLLMAFIYVIVNLIVDLLYTVLDPRITYG